MIGLLCFALAVLASPFKSKLRLEAENTVLRHQLIVLRRRLHGRVRFTNNDRWFLIQLYRWSCVYRKLKPARSDGEARRGPDVNESFRPDESDGKSAHPCAETDVF